MEVASTREYPSVRGRCVYPSAHFDDIGMDGKRECHRVCQGPPEAQSPASRE